MALGTARPSPIGEVVAAETARFTAECYEVHCPPPLGSLVRAGEALGVVFRAETAGLEPGRVPIARGRGYAREEDVYRENPQLAKLLRTTFESLAVGSWDGQGLAIPRLPPAPPRLHGFVYLCPPEAVRAFTASWDFLDRLLAGPLGEASDQALAACLRAASATHPDSRAFLVAAGKELAPRLRGDLPRLTALLRGMRP
ncbi:MAG: hypothetical protein HY687_03095 [Chloroflexi bacterium]|nr:hypothetical protein [Chloroflexota bacterium]